MKLVKENGTFDGRVEALDGTEVKLQGFLLLLGRATKPQLSECGRLELLAEDPVGRYDRLAGAKVAR